MRLCILVLPYIVIEARYERTTNEREEPMKRLKQISRRKLLGPLAVATLASFIPWVLLTQGAHAGGKKTKAKVKKKGKGGE